MSRPLLVALLACVFTLGYSAGYAAAEPEALPTPAPTPPVAELKPRPAMVPQAKLVKAVTQRRALQKRVRVLTAALRTSPDFRVSFQLAAIAHRQDARHLERCALSEGGRLGERFKRHNPRPNSTGSGATGLMQFMHSTFLSTPYAGMNWLRQDVQAHAAAWMWAQGRRGEWAGAGC